MYVPDMQARVFTPKTFLALVRQRRRWARGWAQATMQHGIDILRAGRTMGWPRSFGLLWVLITSINAPLYTVFPAIIIVWLLGLGADLPLWLVASFGLIILPAKAIAYGYAAWSDPAIPIRRNPIRIAEVVVHAYLWILATWIIQLHALYLHLAGAPKIWEPTTKADAEWINRHSETWDGEDSVEESQLPGY